MTTPLTNIEAVAKRMSLTIPKPIVKPTKPAQSWRTLKPKQYLTNNLAFKHNSQVAPVGTMWHIHSVNSSGIDLETVSLTPIQFHWTLKDWKLYFTKVRKPTKKQLVDLLLGEN